MSKEYKLIKAYPGHCLGEIAKDKIGHQYGKTILNKRENL